jgi:hypothetical protein
LGGQRVGPDWNRSTIRFQFLPGGDEIRGQSLSALGIGLKLADQIFQGSGEQFTERLAVAISQAFAGGFGGKTGGQTVVVVKAAIVIPGGSQVDHPLKREREMNERAAAQVIRGGKHITPLDHRVQNAISPKTNILD